MHLYQEAEKFIKDVFWSQTHDKDNSLDIPGVIGERLVKDNEEKDPEYYNHREGVIHVSSLSKCLRGVVHEMLGSEKDSAPDARKLGVFKAGNLFEDFIVDALGDRMLDRQTEYVFKYKNVILTGRDDGTMDVDGRKLLECKSVNSQSFWYRQQEGTLAQYNNQMQIQTYLWLRRTLPNVFHYGNEIIYTNLSREELITFKEFNEEQTEHLDQVEKPDESNLNGIFAYISKDDCTIAQAPVKFNQNIINEVVLPAIELVIEGYTKKDPSVVPAPPLTTYSQGKGQHQKNWLCTYCDYHKKCAGQGWELEASNEASRLNREGVGMLKNQFKAKTPTPEITVKPVIDTTPTDNTTG